MAWPQTRDELVAVQRELATVAPPPWDPGSHPVLVGGCFICFAPAPGSRGLVESAWAGAALLRNTRLVAVATAQGAVGFPYEPGLLALREGPLLEAAVRSLPEAPELLVVNATGRDHPRRAGLALHVGAVLDVPTVGVTDRPLLATGPWPRDERKATEPLLLEGEVVGHWVRSRTGSRPIAVHAGWGTSPEIAVASVVTTLRRARTPEPLRRARRAARLARAGEQGSD